MKTKISRHEPPAIKPEAVREEAAQQLKDSELAAKEVADLCAQALDKARRAHVPHAGVGAPQHSDL